MLKKLLSVKSRHGCVSWRDSLLISALTREPSEKTWTSEWWGASTMRLQRPCPTWPTNDWCSAKSPWKVERSMVCWMTMDLSSSRRFRTPRANSSTPNHSVYVTKKRRASSTPCSFRRSAPHCLRFRTSTPFPLYSWPTSWQGALQGQHVHR